MSLINKMLQDLDARGTTVAEAYPAQVRPVRGERRTPSLRVVAASAAGAVAGMALAWFGWQHAHRAEPAAPAVMAKPASATAPVAPAADTVSADAAPGVEPSAAPAPEPAQPVRTAVVPAPAGKEVTPLEPDSDEARALRRALAATLATRQAAPVPRQAALQAPQQAAHRAPHQVTRQAVPQAAPPAAAAPAPRAAQGEGMVQVGRESAVQRAESAYRRALASLQEGRMGETLAALEDALRIDPGHEAARQTLVGLLVEAGRADEAMRQLQLGLARDPRQPALAMLLARLQIEHGGNGIDTLMRTLPYAGDNPDYHAFLAGALQREQRHREAAEQYLLAVRGVPANGVWWMGLGISLQAGKRDAEALESFRRAQASGTLSRELNGFVERRIQQLAR